MKIATVDIGTNTILVLEAILDGESLRAESDEMEIVRLGEGLDKSGRLSEAAMARALRCLEQHGERLRARRPDHVAAVATEAVRKAQNGAEFLERAGRALGHPVAAIDGEREAHLSWLATCRSLPARAATEGRTAPRVEQSSPPHPGRRTVVDIGGGSTELVIGEVEHARIDEVISLPIGSVRLTERLLKHDPPTEEDRRALAAAVDLALDGAPRPEGDLVGIAGTVTTLCAVHLGLASYEGSRVHGQRMRRAEVEAVVARLGGLRADERRRVPGLDPRRADVIFAGGVILCRILARAPVDELIVSDRGIRWGLAYELAEAALGHRPG
jgi:exopolyphosphatase/guanosine-5'-triphosphate,3'-diphosphate pyrophosphatase